MILKITAMELIVLEVVRMKFIHHRSNDASPEKSQAPEKSPRSRKVIPSELHGKGDNQRTPNEMIALGMRFAVSRDFPATISYHPAYPWFKSGHRSPGIQNAEHPGPLPVPSP